MMKLRMGAVLVLLLLGCTVLSGAAAEDVWMLAVHVGKGDAILIGVDQHAALIDTGYPYVQGRIRTAMEYMGVTELDAVFITHTDNDHTGGLDWLSASDLPVGTWYASAMYMDTSEKKHPLAVAARSRGQEPQWLKAGDRVQLGSAVFSVLAPIEQADDKDDNNSLVMMLETSEGTILLPGDMEFPEEEMLMDSGVSLKCDVLKVANHGDNDTTSEEFMRYAQPQVAVISTSSEEKPGTPSSKVLRILQKAGAETVSTEDAQVGVLVRLKGGKPETVLLDMEKPFSSVQIEQIDTKDDQLVLANHGSEDTDLSGWYLYSERGNEIMTFPEGTTIRAGDTLTVGTLSSKQDSDLVWQDKKVIHQKKSDTLTLYDRYGFQISQKENGL